MLKGIGLSAILGYTSLILGRLRFFFVFTFLKVRLIDSSLSLDSVDSKYESLQCTVKWSFLELMFDFLSALALRGAETINLPNASVFDSIILPDNILVTVSFKLLFSMF